MKFRLVLVFCNLIIVKQCLIYICVMSKFEPYAIIKILVFRIIFIPGFPLHKILELQRVAELLLVSSGIPLRGKSLRKGMSLTIKRGTNKDNY